MRPSKAQNPRCVWFKANVIIAHQPLDCLMIVCTCSNESRLLCTPNGVLHQRTAQPHVPKTIHPNEQSPPLPGPTPLQNRLEQLPTGEFPCHMSFDAPPLFEHGATDEWTLCKLIARKFMTIELHQLIFLTHSNNLTA